MTQATVSPDTSSHAQSNTHGKASLGPLLCWAVVFADIGSSIYYVPGILYNAVGALAGFFVLLTMVVFVLLTLKYAEVSQRFPEGGGVVSVAAQAINSWAGALGGMLILVSYFLTAAISCASAIQYFGVVFTAVLPFALWITIGVLILLGFLNWVGISESAKVSLIGAIVAFGSDLAILWTVFTHLSPAEVFSLIHTAFARESLTPTSLLVGFAGAFLAFSGLESISQLSPVMKAPRKKVIGLALFLVALTIGITSPLLTMLATLLQPQQAADPVLSTQLVSLLGGHWGSVFLQTEVAISASLILVFASNTAIIGAYHVFLALSRMEFFPGFILKRNRFRDTPHWSIALATGIPIIILLIVNGNINLLGDLYAFGLLGAFTITCLGLDLIRMRERSLTLHREVINPEKPLKNGHTELAALSPSEIHLLSHLEVSSTTSREPIRKTNQPVNSIISSLLHNTHALWQSLDFWLGLFTTALVALAWVVGLVSRPQAAIFGGTVALLGMGVAYINYTRQGHPPLVVTSLEGRIPDSVLAVLTTNDPQKVQVIEAAINNARGKPVVFLYLGEQENQRIPQPFEIVDPYLDDTSAKTAFSKAEMMARKARITRRFLYRRRDDRVAAVVWQILQPRDVVLSAKTASNLHNINPDRIRYELTPNGKIAHLLKHW